MQELITRHDVIPPGKFLHYVFQVASTAPLDVSVVDRQDIEAEAVLDQEGWCVIIITNVVGVPVVISEHEPLRLVIVPRRAISENQEVAAVPGSTQK